MEGFSSLRYKTPSPKEDKVQQYQLLSADKVNEILLY